MATLTLKPKTAAKKSKGHRKPVRGVAAPRRQLTLAEAQAERAERERQRAEEHRPARRGEPPRREGRPDERRRPPAEGGARPRRDDARPPRSDGRPPREGRPPIEGRPPRDARPPRPDRPPFSDRPPRPDSRPARDAGPPRGERRPPRGEVPPPDRRPPRDARPPRPDSRPPRDGRPPLEGRPLREGRPPRPPADARRDGTAPPRARPPRPERPPPHGDRSARPERPERPPRVAPAPASPERAAEGERLSKRMTALGLSSRREADDWIAAGLVRVDGQVAVLGQRVRPDARIEIDPAARQLQAQRVTVLVHKPIGYVSGQAEDGYEPAVVLVKPENRWEDDPSGVKYSPAHLKHLAPAGRLDIDSTGLLVLTQDGRIAKALVGDESSIEKEYLVRVRHEGEGRLPNDRLELLRHGLELDGHALAPAKVSWQNEDQLRFVLREGRKRQIRRMCAAVGLEVLGLKRVRIGRIALGALPPGQWRYLAPFEKF